jgi:hypothetical protein
LCPVPRQVCYCVLPMGCHPPEREISSQIACVRGKHEIPRELEVTDDGITTLERRLPLSP